MQCHQCSGDCHGKSVIHLYKALNLSSSDDITVSTTTLKNAVSIFRIASCIDSSGDSCPKCLLGKTLKVIRNLLSFFLWLLPCCLLLLLYSATYIVSSISTTSSTRTSHSLIHSSLLLNLPLTPHPSFKHGLELYDITLLIRKSNSSPLLHIVREKNKKCRAIGIGIFLYGPLKNVWVARNPPGFAFVEFEDPRDAEDSVRGLDGTRVCGQRVRVEMSSGQSRNGGSRRDGRGSGRRRDDRVRRGDSAERVRRRRRSPSYRSIFGIARLTTYRMPYIGFRHKKVNFLSQWIKCVRIDSNVLMMLRLLTVTLFVSCSLGMQEPLLRVARKTGFTDCSNTDGINMCDYESHEELVYKLKELSIRFPELCEIGTIGQSEEGRLLVYAKLGLRPRGLGKPLFKYVGNMHGNEVIGRQVLLYLTEFLLENYGINKRVTRLLDSTEIWIIPSLNPDGYETSVEGSCSRGPGRTNANRVDLNRDFPKQFDEPQRLFLSFLSANLHGGAVVASYPLDDSKAHITGLYSASPDDDVFVFISRTYATQWYDVPGGMQDYNYVHSNCFEITLELSCCKHPTKDNLVQEWINNKDALLSYMESVHTGVHGLVIDRYTRAPIRNTMIHVKGNPKSIKGTNRG
ncbi:CPD [Lepeophtheirus salmonis]|uniref:CPD n=1 Tax=Lepeophtheirus salmonis TaxID=72036 RepID=A0A7R8CIU8_LEPSM|nr:CPD [Lepeophtheirus salmonis]CAF2781339.1 CPD [Lepeophtheirus salmonis]